jgi:transposase
MLLEGIDWRTPLRTAERMMSVEVFYPVFMRFFFCRDAPFSWHTAPMPEALLEDLDALDLEAARALVRTQREQLRTQQRKLSSHETEIAHLKLLLDKLRRMLFGAKSEKLVRHVEQLELQLEELEAVRSEDRIAEPLPKTEAVAPPDVAPEPTRRSLPEHLPREIETHLPEKTCCPDCGGKLRKFGEDVTEMLERIPESFKVIRHVRPKFCCSHCDTVIEAPAPSRPIAGSYAGPGLLAHVLVSKYADHTPLYRQSEIYASRWRRTRSLDTGRMGRRFERSACAAGRSCPPSRVQRSQAARRRHAGSGARSGQRQDEDRQAVDLRARWPPMRRCSAAGGLVRLLARPSR